MMMTLMRDLMNQAAMANNTFQMVSEHFDMIKLLKSCINTLSLQAKHKQVTLKGPVFATPLQKYYFLSLFGDARRYGQFILNFLTNSIKFTPVDGEVTVHLNVLSVKDICKKQLKPQASAFLDESLPSASIGISSIGDGDNNSDAVEEE